MEGETISGGTMGEMLETKCGKFGFGCTGFGAQADRIFGAPPSFGLARTRADRLSRPADLTQRVCFGLNSAAILAAPF